MSRRYTKIGYNRKVQLEWIRRMGDDPASIKRPSESEPAPSFEKALQAFVPYVLRTFGLTKKRADEFRVTSVSISRPDGEKRRAIVVTAVWKRDSGSSAINTPLRREPFDAQEKGPRFLDNEDVDLLEALIAEADKFQEGHREQTELGEETGPGTQKDIGDELEEADEPE